MPGNQAGGAMLSMMTTAVSWNRASFWAVDDLLRDLSRGRPAGRPGTHAPNMREPSTCRPRSSRFTSGISRWNYARWSSSRPLVLTCRA